MKISTKLSALALLAGALLSFTAQAETRTNVFDFKNNPLGWPSATALEYFDDPTAGNVPATGYVVGDVTMTATNGNSNTYLKTGSYLLIDENGTITFKAGDGRAITAITFTDKSGKFMLTADEAGGTLTDHTWTGNATKVTFTSAVNDMATKTWLVDATVTTDEANGDTYTPTEAPIVCQNIAAFKALEVGKSGKLMLNNARVGYVDWNSTYIEDESGAIELYKVRALSLTNGDVLNGSVVLKRSQMLIFDEQVEAEEPGREKPEAAADALTTADEVTATAGTPTATVLTPSQLVSDDNFSRLVRVENVTLTKPGRFAVLDVDGYQVNVKDMFFLGIDIPTDRPLKSVTVIYTWDGAKPAIYVTAIDDTATAISQVQADAATDGDVYTITGICLGRVDLSTLPAGLYIQGGRKLWVR